MLSGYKPIRYAEIPEDFDQTKQYIIQAEPEEHDNEIYVGNEMHELDLDDEDEELDEDVL